MLGLGFGSVLPPAMGQTKPRGAYMTKVRLAAQAAENSN